MKHVGYRHLGTNDGLRLQIRSSTFAARVKRSPLSPTLMFNTSFSTRIWRIGFLGKVTWQAGHKITSTSYAKGVRLDRSR